MQSTLFPFRRLFIPANGCLFETAVAGDGDKLALLLHGFPETYFSWRHQIQPLVDQGYTVWAPNMRGYGQSSRPPKVSDYAIDHLLADVAGLMDVASARGLRPSLLGAHDWGGAIAWLFVLRQIRALDRFFVVNLPHPALFRKNIWKGGQLFKSWYILFFQIPWLPEALLSMNQARAIKSVFLMSTSDRSRFPEEVLQVYRDNAALPGCARAMINYYRANMGFSAGKDRREAFKPLTTDLPTLMVWGEEDIALSVRLLDGTQDLVPNLTLHRLPGVSHWAQQEAPEAVNAALTSWLAS